MFHQANSRELFRLCSLDLKMSSVVSLTNEISLENMKNDISAIHEHFSLKQRSNSSFQKRGLVHIPPPVSLPFFVRSGVNVITSNI
uniref:Uncharacterized protein n=1 Tax=Equus caballus TaxID=9796 RepID=A0A9L0RAC9_HORSE